MALAMEVFESTVPLALVCMPSQDKSATWLSVILEMWVESNNPSITMQFALPRGVLGLIFLLMPSHLYYNFIFYIRGFPSALFTKLVFWTA